jgi:hypothetical protein
MPFRDMGRDFGIASDIADALTLKVMARGGWGEHRVTSGEAQV